MMDRFRVPRGLFFGPNHTWVDVLPTGNVRVGIDDFAQKVIGRIDGVWTIPQGVLATKGKPVITLKQGQRTLTISSPVSGKVIQVNHDLQENPAILRNDPYVAGWILLLEPENIDPEIKSLTVGDEVARRLRQEVARFRDFIRTHTTQHAPSELGLTMGDGGLPTHGVLESVDANAWSAFEEEFLTTVT
jgi:glycine cleavage system H lipoate-binding protein